VTTGLDIGTAIGLGMAVDWAARAIYVSSVPQRCVVFGGVSQW
jgi:hypothetical protein